MVNGIETFREKFKDYTDCYTVIGGAACEILMTDADMAFRATKDIDMIVVLEDRYMDFARVFWEYIHEGQYRCGWKNSETVHFYRFTDPAPGFPSQIEPFSRKPDYHVSDEKEIIPIHFKEDISSLSAILLNDDFYNFMLEGREVIDGICVLGAVYLIPFKMFAWLDLIEKKARGEHVNDRDLKKHKYDVFRLSEIIPSNKTIPVRGLVAKSIDRFIERIREEPLSLAQIGLSVTKEQALFIFKSIYEVIP
jgi:hypothetical protein